MNIAVDVRSLMEGRHSGVQEYTVQIIRAMARAAPRHTYHLFYNCARKVTLPDFGPRTRVHAFGYPNKMFNLLQLVARRPRWDKLVPADCYFVPGFRLTPLSPGAPLVAVAHDLSFKRFPELYSLRRRAWHKLVRPRRLLENANRILAVSEATAYDLRAVYGIASDRIDIVYSGVAERAEVTSRERASAKARYKLPERFVLYLGTLEPRKNVVSIVRAFDAIADDVSHHLVIAGASGWLTGDIDRVLSEANHRERIHTISFVEERHKAAVYELADLFVYPSLYEGFGFPPLEALVSGTPVITSCNSSLPEVVGSWSVMVNPYDSSELALVMRELLRDLPEVSEKDKQEIKTKYSWDRAARQTLAVLEGVVTGNS